MPMLPWVRLAREYTFRLDRIIQVTGPHAQADILVWQRQHVAAFRRRWGCVLSKVCAPCLPSMRSCGCAVAWVKLKVDPDMFSLAPPALLRRRCHRVRSRRYECRRQPPPTRQEKEATCCERLCVELLLRPIVRFCAAARPRLLNSPTARYSVAQRKDGPPSIRTCCEIHALSPAQLPT